MILSDEINRIINNVPQNLTELEIVRYVYLELGKVIRHDTVFKFSENSTEKSNIFDKTVGLPESVSKDVICNSSSEVFVYILNRLNINAFCHYYDCIKHADALFKTRDGSIYYTNLIGDLSRIQTGRTTKNFAPEKYHTFLKDEIISVYGQTPVSVSKEKLHEIDDKLGYTFKGVYLDDFFDELQKELEDPSNVEKYILSENSSFKSGEDRNIQLLKYKFQFMLDHMQIFNEQNGKLGYCESMTYYHILLHSIFSHKELPKIKRYDCYKKDDLSNENMISIIALNLDKAIEYYMFSNETNKFSSISREELENLLSESFHSNDFHRDEKYSILGVDEREF